MASTEISSRLDALIGGCGYRSLRSFATAAGVSPISFQGNVALGKEPRFSTLESILKSFPQISAEWLMRGEGEMFRMGEQPASVIHIDKSTRAEGENGVTGADATLVELLRKEVDSLQEQVRNKDEQIRNKDSQIAALLAIMSK